MRGVLAPFTHPVFTCMTGIGLGLAVVTRRRWVRVVAPAGGLLTAIGLHSLWNTAATVEGGVAFVGVYFLIMVPIFFGLIAVALASIGREGRVVRERLQPEVAAGLLTAGDVELLTSLRDRRRARQAAKRDGPAARRAMRAFQLAATELAFRRDRAARGLPTGATPAVDEREFVIALNALGERLGPQVQALRGQAQRAMEWRAAYAMGPAPSAARAPAPAAASGHPRVPAASALPPPGWHTDPWGRARLRWWDGRAWTGHVTE